MNSKLQRVNPRAGEEEKGWRRVMMEKSSMDGQDPEVRMSCCRKVSHVIQSLLVLTRLFLAIDYLHELLSEREVLMQRLQVARNTLPVNHPLLQSQPDAPLPLWEQKWSGGEKGNDDDDDDDDDD